MPRAEICTCAAPQLAIFLPVTAGWGETEIPKYRDLFGKAICFDCGGVREDARREDCDHVTGGTVAMRLEEL